jgi:hypothetical protein
LRSATAGQIATRLFLAKAVANAKQRAKHRGIPFDLTLEYLAGILPPVCPVLGIKLRIHYRQGHGPRDSSPSLDCVIPHRGYVPGNVKWVSSRANRIKSDASVPELEAILAHMKEYL